MLRGSRMNGNKRVFLVTDNDEPPGSSSTRQAARTTFGVSCPSLKGTQS
jgi:ATP-dependent DNA helicase 2 subunit 1